MRGSPSWMVCAASLYLVKSCPHACLNSMWSRGRTDSGAAPKPKERWKSPQHLALHFHWEGRPRRRRRRRTLVLIESRGKSSSTRDPPVGGEECAAEHADHSSSTHHSHLINDRVWHHKGRGAIQHEGPGSVRTVVMWSNAEYAEHSACPLPYHLCEPAFVYPVEGRVNGASLTKRAW